MKKPWYKDNQKLALVAVITAIMYMIGLLFEKTGLGSVSFSYVKLSPAEGLILVPLTLFGLSAAAITGFAYILLMIISGVGISSFPVGIGIISLAAAMFTYVFGYMLGQIITRPFASKLKEPLRGYVNLVIATLSVTVVMTLLNIIVITPSYALGRWATVFQMMDEYFMSFWDSVKYVIIPPAGILHGNILKYLLCSVVAGTILTNRAIWKFKTVKSKTKAIRN